MSTAPKMTATRAAKVLREFNQWRRTKSSLTPQPNGIGDAIDFAVAHLSRRKKRSK